MKKKATVHALGRKPIVPSSAMKFRVHAGENKPFYCLLCKKSTTDIYKHYCDNHRSQSLGGQEMVHVLRDGVCEKCGLDRDKLNLFPACSGVSMEPQEAQKETKSAASAAIRIVVLDDDSGAGPCTEVIFF